MTTQSAEKNLLNGHIFCELFLVVNRRLRGDSFETTMENLTFEINIFIRFESPNTNVYRPKEMSLGLFLDESNRNARRHDNV